MLVTASEQVGCDELPPVENLSLSSESPEPRLPSPRGELAPPEHEQQKLQPT